ncbi:MAG: VWA domain-containing protein [Acidobacteria bacterium]|nr:VWA domain-containing protein [Acidobacteriota bacterium]
MSLFLLTGSSISFPSKASTGRAGAPQKEPPQNKKPPQPDSQDKDDTPIKLGTDLITLDVSVIDTSANNTAVMNLTQKDFQVLEDKVPQEIKFFSKDQVPVSVVFTIDSSGSMRQKIDTVIKTSINLVKDSKPGDEMAVIEFRDTPELLQEFTKDQNDVIDTLNSLVARSQTAMLDAVYLAADYAQKEAKNRRRALIVVTDGLDKENYYKFDDVVKHLQESDVQVYLIGFTQDLDNGSGLFKKSPKDKAEALLNKLATETGGRAFFPKELSEVHTIGQQISTDLRTQYAIGYYPSNEKRDGLFRSVRVTVNSAANRRLVARTRTGYFAPNENAASKTAKP